MAAAINLNDLRSIGWIGVAPAKLDGYPL